MKPQIVLAPAVASMMACWGGTDKVTLWGSTDDSTLSPSALGTAALSSGSEDEYAASRAEAGQGLEHPEGSGLDPAVAHLDENEGVRVRDAAAIGWATLLPEQRLARTAALPLEVTSLTDAPLEARVLVTAQVGNTRPPLTLLSISSRLAGSAGVLLSVPLSPLHAEPSATRFSASLSARMRVCPEAREDDAACQVLSALPYHTHVEGEDWVVYDESVLHQRYGSGELARRGEAQPLALDEAERARPDVSVEYAPYGAPPDVERVEAISPESSEENEP